MPDQVMFVQFPHGGAERRPGGLEAGWSPLYDARGREVDHARKFLRSHGSYLAGVGERPASGPLAFWGEWEPQSRVIHDYGQGDRGWPRWLHEPYWQCPGVPFARHNTDPLVFGEHFFYSNCRQARNGKLRRLASGSVILFGSKERGETEFILDTVMVIGDGAADYGITYAGDVPDGPGLVQGVVFEPLRSALGGAGDELRFRLYRGRSYEEAPDGPFSFVPCLPADDPAGCAFARPVIRLPRRWLTPSSWRGAKCTPAGPDELRSLWCEVVRQVVDRAGLALGVSLDAPEQVVGEAERISAAGTAGTATKRPACAGGGRRPATSARC